MKISASVYSNKTKELLSLVQELDGYDVAVFQDIQKIHEKSQTPCDLHIISAEVKKFHPYLSETQPAQVCFQLENLKENLSFPADYRGKKGIAILTESDLSLLKPWVNQVDFILMMTTVPGKSGGTFRHENFKKIRACQRLYPNIPIHVDGGVDGDISFVLRNMGIHLVVSGSFLVNADVIGHAMFKLKSLKSNSTIRIKDFMLEKEEIPVVQEGKFSFKEALQSIEDGKTGFTLVQDKDGKLAGIITNADVRKAILKQTESLDNISPESLINRKPLVINENETVSDLFETIRQAHFPVSYLPVINDYMELTGAITFFNLIKGES
jgi:pentose-5-phosphate-3-epimerase/CBS domain-containing protein